MTYNGIDIIWYHETRDGASTERHSYILLFFFYYKNMKKYGNWFEIRYFKAPKEGEGAEN